MTTTPIAGLYFRGNAELTRHLLHDEGYIPQMLGKRRFNCCLHRLQDLFLTLFRLLGETWKELNERSVYVLDSYSITALPLTLLSRGA